MDNAREDFILPEEQQLWQDTTSFEIPLDSDSVDNRLPFDIDIDSLSGGNIRLKADYTFREDGFLDSAQMKMFACFADSTRDTVSTHIHKSFKKVEGNLLLPIDQDKQVISIEGFLFDHDTSEVSSVIIEDVQLTFFPVVKGLEVVK